LLIGSVIIAKGFLLFSRRIKCLNGAWYKINKQLIFECWINVSQTFIISGTLQLYVINSDYLTIISTMAATIIFVLIILSVPIIHKYNIVKFVEWMFRMLSYLCYVICYDVPWLQITMPIIFGVTGIVFLAKIKKISIHQVLFIIVNSLYISLLFNDVNIWEIVIVIFIIFHIFVNLVIIFSGLVKNIRKICANTAKRAIKPRTRRVLRHFFPGIKSKSVYEKSWEAQLP
jgi:hypothetical protein